MELSHLVKLTRFSSSTKQAIDYSKIVHENFVKRELLKISTEIKDETLGNDEEKSTELIIENAEKLLFDLAERDVFAIIHKDFNLALDQSINMAEQAMKSDQGIVGVPTGLTDLDGKLGGLHKSDNIIIAGRPSMGKARLCNEYCLSCSKKYQAKGLKSQLLFSLEMSSEQLSTRILSEQSRINLMI